MAAVSVALATARTLLNDDAATLWTDAVLLPKLKEAHRELQVKLALGGIPVLREVSSVLTVPALTTDLTGVGSYPTDLIEPIELKEKANGAQDRDFQPMTEVAFIPQVQQSESLVYWSWREEKIYLLGATTIRQVMIRYWKGLTVPTAVSDQIGFIFGENYLGHRTAALAASSVGNDSAYDEWNREAMSKIDEIIRFNIREQQNLPVRRRGYHRGSYGTMRVS